MHRVPLSLLLSLLVVPVGFGQSTSTNSQVTEALLTEIRQLRLELQGTAATIQRVQIVMYRLQAQADVLNRATGREDHAREECNQAQQQRTYLTRQIEAFQTRLQGAQNAQEKSAAEQAIANFRSNLEVLAAEDTECRARATEAEIQLRAEQAKMSDLEDQLDKLDKILEKSGK
jgi:chromosome segregation ATPase